MLMSLSTHHNFYVVRCVATPHKGPLSGHLPLFVAHPRTVVVGLGWCCSSVCFSEVAVLCLFFN